MRRIIFGSLVILMLLMSTQAVFAKPVFEEAIVWDPITGDVRNTVTVPVTITRTSRSIVPHL